jgi:hypothetical protein
MDGPIGITSVELGEERFRWVEETLSDAVLAIGQVDVERRAEARPPNRPCGRCSGRWTGDLSVGALDPVLGAQARFDETSRVGDPLPLSRSGHG